MVDIMGIVTYRMFGGKRFKFKAQCIRRDMLREKKRRLRADGWLVRTHLVQMPIHKKYQIYVRRP